jgi:hypothetical protein
VVDQLRWEDLRRSRPAQGTKTCPQEGCDSQSDEVIQVFRRRGRERGVVELEGFVKLSQVLVR